MLLDRLLSTAVMSLLAAVLVCFLPHLSWCPYARCYLCRLYVVDDMLPAGDCLSSIYGWLAVLCMPLNVVLHNCLGGAAQAASVQQPQAGKAAMSHERGAHVICIMLLFCFSHAAGTSLSSRKQF